MRVLVGLALVLLAGVGGYVASNLAGEDSAPAVVAPISPTPTATPPPPPTMVPVVAQPTPVPAVPTAVPPTPPPAPSATPLPTIAPPPTPAPGPLPTATPTRVERLTALRLMMVDLINEARAARGLGHVDLVYADSGASAAQSHADDMLTYNYVGHWWINGQKPYMVYAALGGDSYVEENVYDVGLTDVEWAALGCGLSTPPAECVVPTPELAIEQMHAAMVEGGNDDERMRENMLNGNHRKVSIGVAWNERRVVLVQHFEGGDVVVENQSLLLVDNRRHLIATLRKADAGAAIHNEVHIYHDPQPTALSPARVEALGRYCLGGGATASCPEPLARVVPPGAASAGMPENVVVASEWTETDKTLIFAVDLSLLAQPPGVYTVVFWRDTGAAVPTEILVALPAMELN